MSTDHRTSATRLTTCMLTSGPATRNKTAKRSGFRWEPTSTVIKAKEAGVTPQEYTDQHYGNFEALMKKVDAQFTDFIRTTDPHHVAAVQYIWKKLAPHIYKSTYEGWYCQGCERFVTDKEATATGGICPYHNIPHERLSEENYYLRASTSTN